MQTQLAHMQLNVQPANLAFYTDLLAFLGWQTLYATDEMLGMADTNGVSLWFAGQSSGAIDNYDGPGMNHLAFGASSAADVDTVVEYLQQHGIAPLFETPRHRAEFSQSEQHTYYQVMFETPDRILVEVVYIGPKTA